MKNQPNRNVHPILVVTRRRSYYLLTNTSESQENTSSCIKMHLNNTVNQTSVEPETAQTPTQAMAMYASSDQVSLATAMVYVKDKDGNAKEFRAILDSGSQVDFATQDCAR